MERATEAGVPVVLVNRAIPARSLDNVRWDNRGGIIAAVDHLVELGHRRIAHLVGPAHRQSTNDRIAGYRDALYESGIDYDASLVARAGYDDDPETWAEAALGLLQVPDAPTAIIAADDIVAGMVMRSLAICGIRHPG